MKLLVISPTADPNLAAKMVATANRVGIHPMLYGLNSHHPHGKDYQGTDIVRILEERRDAEIVMGVDAPDVAFVTGEQEILLKFDEFGTKFVMSTEYDGVRGLDKTAQRIYEMCAEARGPDPHLRGYFPHPNIGCWMGERKYALEVFNEAERLYKDKPENPNYSYDNHYQWITMMKAWGGGPEFSLDYDSVIFQSMNKAVVTAVTDVDSTRRVQNVLTGSWPCVLHYNGDPTRGAYTRMVELILKG